MNYILIRTVGQLFVWMILLASCLYGSVRGENATSLFQQAMTAEKSHGDHQAALRLYQQVIDRYGKADVRVAKKARERIASLGGESVARDQIQIGDAAKMQKQNVAVSPRDLRDNANFVFSRSRILKRQQSAAQNRLQPTQQSPLVGFYSHTVLSRMQGDQIQEKVYTRDSYLFWAGTLQQALGLNRIVERVAFFSNRKRKVQTLSFSDLYIAGLIAEKEREDKTVAIDFYRRALDGAPEKVEKHIRLRLDILSKK